MMIKMQNYEMVGDCAAMKGIVLLTGGGTAAAMKGLVLLTGGGTVPKGTKLPLPGGAKLPLPEGTKFPLPEEGGEQPFSHL